MRNLRAFFIYTMCSLSRLQIAAACLVLILPLKAQNNAILIDITNLEQLDAMRFDLNGDGMIDMSASLTDSIAYEAAFSLARKANVVCPGGCEGYELMADLDFAGTKWENPSGGTFSGTHVPGGWLPIADNNTDTDATRFTGTFEGNDNTISNLYINRPDSTHVGLFGYITGTISNLGIVGGSVTGKTYVGCLAGFSESSDLRNCYATGDATAAGSSARTGGLVGISSGGKIINCYATGDATADDRAGGLVGSAQNSPTISGCYATGNAMATSVDSEAGGLVGYIIAALVQACYATGNAMATGNNGRAGGLVGNFLNGNIRACYATGNAEGNRAGGLVGRTSNPTIRACYATGNAMATGSNSRAGGLVGVNGEEIIASYSIGNATASGSGSKARGLVGANNGAVTKSYFDRNTSNRGGGDDYDKTTKQLQSPLGYTALYSNWDVDVGGAAGTDPWDFGTNGQYPSLKADWDEDGKATAYEFGVADADGLVQHRAALPRIEDILPLSASVGEVIKIAGRGFSATKNDDSLSFDEGSTYVVASNFISDSRGTSPAVDTIEVAVPPRTEKSKIVAKVLTGVPTVSSQTLVIVPRINSLSPLSGPLGTVIKIAGTGFSATAADNQASFGGDYLSASDYFPDTRTGVSPIDTLEVEVPNNAETGPINLRILEGPASTSTESFRIIGIRNFSPKEGLLSTVVKIAGIGFSSIEVENKVAFGSGDFVSIISFTADSRATSPSVDTLTVAVPDGTPVRKVRVKVIVQNGAAVTSSATFQVLPSPDVLIDVDDLEKLHAIRFDMNGNGRVDRGVSMEDSVAYETAFGLQRKENVRCGGRCVGYELREDLDFKNGSTNMADFSIWAEGSTATDAITEGWLPIGDNSDPFSALFWGNGNTISNLYINRPIDYVGLFGVLDNDADIRDLGLLGGSVTGALVVGCLVGNNDRGTIRSCYATGNATAAKTITGGSAVTLRAGGLVGHNNRGTIRSCYATGTATATLSGSGSGFNDSSVFAGGLIGGSTSGLVHTCYATGDATATGPNGTAGGLVGSTNGRIEDSYATGNAEGPTAGGLVGRANDRAVIGGCYATGTATATESDGNAGGLVGFNKERIEDSYATGDAMATESSSNAGGLVGYSDGGTITRCHATGNAEGVTAGGLVGQSDGGTITRCHATGNAEGPTAGGLVGNAQSSPKISMCYATGNATGRAVGGLVGNATESTIRGCYATGTATGDIFVGGLVGTAIIGTIRGCYATGTATGSAFAASLVGHATAGNTIRACYATGTATSGQLVGSASGGFTIDASYFDYQTVGGSATENYAQSTSSLQSPTTYTGLYAAWNVDVDGVTGNDEPWDFGTSSDYPALKVDYNGDGTATAAEFGGAVISSFSPRSGLVGTEVEIIGTGFSATTLENNVAFGESNFIVAATAKAAVAADPDTLIVHVPKNAETGAIMIKVLDGFLQKSRAAASKSRFNVIPTIEDVLPMMAQIGATIKIAGTGFSTDPMKDSVLFNGSSYVVASTFRPGDTNPDTLTVNVPSGAETGVVMVKVLDGTAQKSRPVASMDMFTVVPAITNIVPMMAQLGATIKIAGTGFSSAFTEDSVLFSGSDYVAASAFTAYDDTNGALDPEIDTVVVTVPSGATTGVIMLKVLDGTPSTSSQVFEVLPTITDIVPRMAQLGATIKISGTGFSSAFAENSVLFSGSDYVSASAFTPYDAATNGALDPEVDTVVVEVPSDAQTGTIMVKVLEGTAATSTQTFMIEPPTIEDIVPRMAQLGEIIKISGTGFSPTASEDSVLFSGSDYVAASNFLPDGRDAATRGSDPLTDTLEVTVPSDAQTGTISVKVLDGTPSTSSDEFEVLPTITNITEMAQLGATIKISGTGFSPTASEDSVLFSGSDYVAASAFTPYDAATNGALDPEIDTLEVAVPSDAQTGVIMLKVLDGTPSTSTQTFTVEGSGSDPTPEITSIDPASGIVGADVTISGQHFGSTPADNEVTFLGVEPDPSPSDNVLATNVTSNGTTELVVIVPDGAMTGKISVTVDGETTTSSQIFTVLTEDELAITNISPTSGSVGADVTITGQNFGATEGENEVTFLGDENDPSDDQVAVVSTANTTQIVVRVPDDAMTGKISVTVDGETTTSSQIFTVLAEDALAITNISPTSGSAGADVTISGQHFGSTPTDNEVTFLGVEPDPSPSDNVLATNVTSNGTTELVVEVPSGAMTGTISVTVDGETTTSSQIFTVLSEDELAITNISPSSGSAGADVTITGQNFGATETDNEVTFLGAENDPSDDQVAVVSTSNTTQIVVRVPEDAMTGKISVTVGSETAISSQVFTVRDGTEPSSPFSVTSSEGEIRVYPNPTSGELHFVNLSHNSTYMYKIYSLLGQEMRSDVLRGATIDVSDLEEGQYILVLWSEESDELLRARLLVVR